MSPQPHPDEESLRTELASWNLEAARQFDEIIKNKQQERRGIPQNPDSDATSFSNGIKNPSSGKEEFLNKVSSQPRLRDRIKKVFEHHKIID